MSIYLSIDLKTFYASCECVERGLDPLKTNLVVADESRTDKTICLAVSPSLKQYGLGGRTRLFEVNQKVKEINIKRKHAINGKKFKGESYDSDELNLDPYLKLSFIKAMPRMNYYMNYSKKIYNIYLKYVSSEDIFAYSIDEVFCDITSYLKTCKMTSREFVEMILKDVYDETGITATAGIGTNMYLAKVAMDIVAKHIDPNSNGAKIAELDEMSYRKLLWDHTPLTDFWRVGKGYAKKLEENGLYTMGDIARCSINNEDILYKLFGVNAETLIDHAWGWECTTIKSVKNYKPQSNSLCSGQVLHEPYNYEKTELIVKEMIDLMALDLVDKNLVTDQIVLEIGYDVENIKNGYKGETVIDRYGRRVPKHAHGTINLDNKTSSSKELMEAVTILFKRIVDPKLLVRRVTITLNKLESIFNVNKSNEYEQIDLFTDYSKKELEEKKKEDDLLKENKLQKTIIGIKEKYGKNSILKGMNYEEGGTSIDRNEQVGGHKS